MLNYCSSCDSSWLLRVFFPFSHFSHFHPSRILLWTATCEGLRKELRLCSWDFGQQESLVGRKNCASLPCWISPAYPSAQSHCMSWCMWLHLDGLIRETSNYQASPFFHFTASEGEHKAVVRGSCHWQLCVFPGWWICIPALSGWLLTFSSQRRLSSGFWFHWAPDKRPWLVQFMSHTAISASFGCSAFRKRPRPCWEVWKRKKEVKQLLKAFCTSLAQIRKTISGLGSFSYIPVIDFYFSAEDQVFLTAWHTQ